MLRAKEAEGVHVGARLCQKWPTEAVCGRLVKPFPAVRFPSTK